MLLVFEGRIAEALAKNEDLASRCWPSVSIQCCTFYGVTALMVACWSARAPLAAVEELLIAGSCPNVTDYSGRPSLVYCALANDREKAVALLSVGANPNGHDRIGQPLLGLVAMTSSDVLEECLAAGGDPNLCGLYQGCSPLQLATIADNPRSVDILLEAGADPMHSDETGRRAMNAARSAEVIRALEKHVWTPSGRGLGHTLPHARLLREYGALARQLALEDLPCPVRELRDLEGATNVAFCNKLHAAMLVDVCSGEERRGIIQELHKASPWLCKERDFRGRVPVEIAIERADFLTAVILGVSIEIAGNLVGATGRTVPAFLASHAELYKRAHSHEFGSLAPTSGIETRMKKNSAAARQLVEQLDTP